MNNYFLDFDLFVVPDPNSPDIKVKGKGEKGIVVLYQPTEAGEALTDFLAKVLSAVKIKAMEDTYLLALEAEDNINLHAFFNQHDINQVLCFGIAPKRLGLHFNYQNYSPIVFKKRTFLFANALHAIYEERQAGGKKMSGALWIALKHIFLAQ